MIATTASRVREHTTVSTNRWIRQKTDECIKRTIAAGPEAVQRRLRELDEEWDIERVLEANFGGFVLGTCVLGTLSNRYWYWLGGLAGFFMLQHALQGWCPPLPIFRNLGFRTMREIDYERRVLGQHRSAQPHRAESVESEAFAEDSLVEGREFPL